MADEPIQNQGQAPAAPAITLDLSKSTPLPPAVTLDLSKSQPLSSSQSEQPNWDLATPRAAGGDGPPGVATGAVKELTKAPAAVGEAIHAIPGVGPKIIPTEGLQAEEKFAQPQGAAEDLGAFGENIAEFAAGEGVISRTVKGLATLHRLSKVPYLLDIMEQYPKSAKALMNIAKSTVVGAGQGAEKGAAEGGADATLAGVKAKEGAVSGAEGAALGSTVAEATGAVAKPIAQKVGLLTDAEDDAIRALQPNKRNYKFAQNWAQAKDRIAKEMGENGTFKNMQEAADRFRDVRTNLWNDEVAPAIQRHAGETFNTTPVANAVRAKITPQMIQHAPEEAKIMQEFANKYTSGTPNFGGARTVADAEKDLEFFNAQLDKEGYWKATPQERANLEKVDGTVSSRAAAVEQLRASLYDHLENAGETDIKDSKRTYGAISSLENDVRGQVNVAGRNRPISLKQVIGLGAGLAHGGPAGIILGVGAPLFDKFYNSPEALLNRAAAKAEPGVVRKAAQTMASGAGTLAKKAAPVAGEKLLRFTGSDGSIYYTPESKKDEVLKKDPEAKFN